MASTSNGGSFAPNHIPEPSTNPYRFPLEPSFLNMEPQDEFIKEIADWVSYMSSGRPNIEIEAKFGVVLDKGTGNRTVHRMGILVETILSPQDASEIRFESKLSAKQHEHLNRMLNARVASTAIPAYPHAPMMARHTQTLDEFYPAPHEQGGDSKLRVTRDDKTGQLIECIIKRRLGDLHVLCPKREVDWRISVNIEEKIDISVLSSGAKPSNSRRKDRIGYEHQHFKIDLTQVSDSSGGRTHELELEFGHPEDVRRLIDLRGREDPEMHGYDQLVAVFVNNCRILSRNVIKT